MRPLFAILLMSCCFFSCDTLKVTSDMDPTTNFEDYKSLEYYGWAEDSDKLLNRFDKERIEKAFGEEFLKRGIDIVEKGQGDMIVTLYIVTQQKTQTTATTTGGGMGYGGYYGYGPGWGWGGGMSTTTFNEYDYTVGTLLVSAYDAKKQKLIWQAAGSGTVEEDPRAREKSIPAAAAKMMAKYPVKKKKKS